MVDLHIRDTRITPNENIFGPLLPNSKHPRHLQIYPRGSFAGYCRRARYWVGVWPPGVKGKRPDIQQLRAFGAFKYVRQLDLSVYMRGMQLNIGPNVSAKGDPTCQ